MNGFFCLCAFIFLTSTPTNQPGRYIFKETAMKKQRQQRRWRRIPVKSVRHEHFLRIAFSSLLYVFHFDITECWLSWFRSRFNRTFVKCSMYISYCFSARSKMKLLDGFTKWTKNKKKKKKEKNWTAAMSIVKCVCLFWSFGFGGCHGTKWQREIGTNVEIYLKHKTS